MATPAERLRSSAASLRAVEDALKNFSLDLDSVQKLTDAITMDLANPPQGDEKKHLNTVYRNLLIAEEQSRCIAEYLKTIQGLLPLLAEHERKVPYDQLRDIRDSLSKSSRKHSDALRRSQSCATRTLASVGSVLSFATTVIFLPVSTLAKYCSRSRQE